MAHGDTDDAAENLQVANARSKDAGHIFARLSREAVRRIGVIEEVAVAITNGNALTRSQWPCTPEEHELRLIGWERGSVF